jgi:hypothetical protein
MPEETKRTVVDCQLLDVAGWRCIGLPSRHFISPDHKVYYQSVVEGAASEARHYFECSAPEAVKVLLKSEGRVVSETALLKAVVSRSDFTRPAQVSASRLGIAAVPAGASEVYQ